ncbi:MAG: DNA translocase FtsK [Pelagibacteraceae bacterium]|nr:MAG: DNA translocase FtsK [Pelagibacteraceae bacterium]
MEKIITFIKLKLIELTGIITIFLGFAYFVSLATYSANNINYVFPLEKNTDNKFFSFFYYLSDFSLQAFGILAFLIFLDLIIWGGYLLIKKKIENLFIKLLFLILSIIFGALFFSINIDQSFWLPDNGFGGFVANFISEKLNIKNNSFGSYFSIIFLSISLICFYLSAGMNIQEWKSIFIIIKNLLVFFPKLIFKIYIKKQNTIKAPDSLFVQENITQKIQEEVMAQEVSPQQQLPLESVKVEKSASFKIPLIKLLDDPVKVESQLDEEIYKTQSKFLENVLLDFSISGEIKRVSAGPVVTLYEFEPTAGIKTSKIINLSEDIARNTSSISTRVATVPGKSTIGIEIPNKVRENVALKEIISSKEFNNKDIKIPITLGKSISGFPIVGDLVSMPHLLIAGTTGSGKSVCINTLILSILYRHKPDDCKIIMIDPKMLELSIYQGIPHLLTPVITEPKKATTALKWVVKEMEKRYREMTEIGVRNISGFNEKTSLEAKKKMPYIVVIVDEMADLMMIAGKEIEYYIQRLAQMARAAGIHIVMATQRPSVDVITGTIKANFPTRISFQVTSKIDSRTILGEQGAELLLGNGDMLFMSSASRIIRIHGPYVSEKEIERVSTFLRLQGTPTYIEEVTKIEEQENDEVVLNAEGKDELYNKAIEIIKTEGKASTSFLQRKLGIGYNRAARIIDQMEEEKIVSPANHVGKREIY